MTERARKRAEYEIKRAPDCWREVYDAIVPFHVETSICDRWGCGDNPIADTLRLDAANRFALKYVAKQLEHQEMPIKVVAGERQKLIDLEEKKLEAGNKDTGVLIKIEDGVYQYVKNGTVFPVYNKDGVYLGERPLINDDRIYNKENND